MITVHWSDVCEGDELDQGGQLWQVERIDHQRAWVQLTRLSDGHSWAGQPRAPMVTRSRSAAQVTMEAAKAAQVVAPDLAKATLPGGWPTMPSLDKYPDPGTARAHLWVFHGTTAGGTLDRDLIDHHGRLHANPDKHYVEHRHET